jgi:hypothetical protein
VSLFGSLSRSSRTKSRSVRFVFTILCQCASVRVLYTFECRHDVYPSGVVSRRRAGPVRLENCVCAVRARPVTGALNFYISLDCCRLPIEQVFKTRRAEANCPLESLDFSIWLVAFVAELGDA